MKRSALIFLCMGISTLLVAQIKFCNHSSASKNLFHTTEHTFGKINFQKTVFSTTSGFDLVSSYHTASFGAFANSKIFNSSKNSTGTADGAVLGVINVIWPPVGPTFLLQNKNKPSKKLYLQKTKITLFIDESSAVGVGQLNRFNTAECILDSLKGDSVIVTLISEEIDIDYRNKYSNITNTYFGSSFSKVQKTVAVKNIVYLQTRNPFRTVLHRGGSVLMSAAVLLIVGSPFAGYHQSADARIAARENVFTAGIACFGASVPLFVLGRPKKYPISDSYLSRKNSYWNILRHY